MNIKHGSGLGVGFVLEQKTANNRDVSTDEELLMSPGMDATIFLVQICIDYIPYFPFSIPQLFGLLNTKCLFKMKKEEGEVSWDMAEENKGEAEEEEETEEEGEAEEEEEEDEEAVKVHKYL